MRPVPLEVSLFIPIYSGETDHSLTVTVDSLLEESNHKSEDYEPEDNSEILKFNQFELNDFIKYLCLPNNKAEPLASRLKEKNLLENTAKITHLFMSFYNITKSLVYSDTDDRIQTI